LQSLHGKTTECDRTSPFSNDVAPRISYNAISLTLNSWRVTNIASKRR